MNKGQPPSAYLNAKSPVERHDALADTLLGRLLGTGNVLHPRLQKEKKNPAALNHGTHIQNFSELPLTMTAKNRHRNSEKSAASSQDDASKKSQTSTSVSGAGGPGPQVPRSGSCLGIVATTVFYIALVGAAGFAAFYLQKVVEEIRETSARQEESARQNAGIGTKLDSVVQQVGGKIA